MPARVKIPPAGGGDYFATRKMQFIQSGCALLDCVLGGGWPLGRISNVVGDKAVGKTLLGIEAAANFAVQYPKGHIWYREAEAAFDVDYAESVGLPEKRVDFGEDGIGTHWDTIEDVFDDIAVCIKQSIKSKAPGLYIIDSLDALSSEAEMGRDVHKGSYNLDKQKILGELFRRQTRGIKSSNIHMMFISQVRDKIGITFGDKHTRSGGKALDFYASQILYLTQLGLLTKTIRGVERPTAVKVRAKAKKNKISKPFRECDFTIRFGYGIDDLAASAKWLDEVGRLASIGIKKDGIGDWLADASELEGQPRKDLEAAVRFAVIANWQEIEKGFMPSKRKYPNG